METSYNLTPETTYTTRIIRNFPANYINSINVKEEKESQKP